MLFHILQFFIPEPSPSALKSYPLDDSSGTEQDENMQINPSKFIYANSGSRCKISALRKTAVPI